MFFGWPVGGGQNTVKIFNFTFFLFRGSRRKPCSICSKHVICLHCCRERAKCSHDSLSSRHAVGWSCHCTCMALGRPLTKQSWIVCIFCRHCQCRSVDRLFISIISLFQTNNCFVLSLEFLLKFSWIYTITLSLITLQGNVYTHVGWSG